MATSSTNKMPLLVDRPMHSFATVGGATCLTSATNLNTPSGGGCILLVDCSANDGGVIDSLSIIANEATTTASNVIVFLSTATTTSTISTANTVAVAIGGIGSTSMGERTNIALPPLSVPVPNLGGDTTVSETDKKNTGLYVPSGALIYVGVDAVLTSPSATTVVHVLAQGGFF